MTNPFIQDAAAEHRSQALSHAVRLGQEHQWDVDEIVAAAEAFVDFLNRGRS